MSAGGSISGTVSAAGDGPLGGICVNVATLGGDWLDGNGTAPDGTYRIPGLAAGQYDVYFSSGCGNEGSYLPQWYDNQPTQETADAVSVSVGETTGSIDAVMQPGGSISGTVTVAGDGPLGGMCVSPVTLDGQWLDGTGTASDGTYSLLGLPAGDYKVYFSPGCDQNGNYVAEWYDGQSSEGDATVVHVSVGQDTGSIDAVLQIGGMISGTVTAAGDGALGGICVNASSTSQDGFGTNTSTSSDGTYTIVGLPSGEYLVSFDGSSYCPDGVPRNYQTQWWDNQPSPDTAQAVSVTVGEDTGSIDAVMQPGGSISGTVTAAGGGALGGICVNAVAANGEFSGGAGTAPDGSYALMGLAAGDYTVTVGPDCGSSGNWAVQWWNDQPAQDTADVVHVTVGDDAGPVDAVMQPGGSITGTVTAAQGGEGLGGIC
jgi:hypothetical protein